MRKNHVIRPLLSSSLRSRLYWLPSIDISSSFSQVLPRFPAGRRWYLFYLFTFSFYSFYPYLYCCFFLPYRSQNIRVRHPIKKKQFPLDGFGVAPIFPSFSLIILFTFTFFKYFPFLFHFQQLDDFASFSLISSYRSHVSCIFSISLSTYLGDFVRSLSASLSFPLHTSLPSNKAWGEIVAVL